MSIKISCLPDTLDAPWNLALSGGLVAVGAGDSLLTDMEAGSYAITWQELPQFDTPAPDTLELGPDANLEFRGIYSRPQTDTGIIEFSVTPADAAWSLTGNGWYATHGTGDGRLAGVPTGTYTLSFGEYPGYLTPNVWSFSLGPDQTVTRIVAYRLAPTLQFPDTPEKLMANFQAIYVARDADAYLDLMHPDFLTILRPETVDEFPGVGTTLDFAEEVTISKRMFSGENVISPDGYLVPAIKDITFRVFAQLGAWTESPAEDLFPGSLWSTFDVDILVDRGQSFSYLRPQGANQILRDPA